MAYAFSKPIRDRNYAISKLTQWHTDVSRTNGDELPPLPKINLSDLSPERQLFLQKARNEKEWRRCTVCYKMGQRPKVCTGCGYANGRKTYYCSRECQRRNWPTHRDFCGEAYELDILLDEHVHLTRKFLKMWNHQSNALTLACDWILRQVLLTNPSINYGEMTLLVHCKSIKAGLDYVLPHTLVLTPVSEALKDGYIGADMLNRQVGFVRFFVDDHWLEHHYINLRLIPQTLPDMNYGKWTRHCYWPWIFASMVAMGPTHTKIAINQWLVLMDALDPLCNEELPGNPLKDFVAPKKLKIGEPWEIYDFDRWQSIVSGVVSF